MSLALQGGLLLCPSFAVSSLGQGQRCFLVFRHSCHTGPGSQGGALIVSALYRATQMSTALANAVNALLLLLASP